jgi:hypothetical protein
MWPWQSIARIGEEDCASGRGGESLILNVE